MSQLQWGQIAMAVFGLIVGIAGYFMPWKYNPFRPRNYKLAAAIPEIWQRRIAKIGGVVIALVCLFIIALTPVLGEFPW
jgi:CDP-diglyceride synthetase